MEWKEFHINTTHNNLFAKGEEWKDGHYLAEVTLRSNEKCLIIFTIKTEGNKFYHNWFEEKEIKKCNYYLHIPIPEFILKKQVKSRTVSSQVKLKILKRDNYRCRYCKSSPAIDENTILHIDHIFPYSKGGETELENLQVLCSSCNLNKSNKIVNLHNNEENENAA